MSSKKGIANTFVWILMGLLVLGLGGFGVTNLGGGIDSIGRVGKTELGLQQYARLLQGEINAEAAARGEAIGFRRAQELGIDQRVLSQMVQAAALEEETRLMGVSIGDENLREQILQIPAFRGIDGSFDREAYRFSLDRSGLTEAQFEEDLRAEAARTLLQAAVVSGVQTPEAYTETLLRYIGERRSITYGMLDRAALETGLPVPDEADMTAYHQTHLPDYTTPLVKRITYAWLTTDMIIDTVEVDEASLREAYDASRDEFNQPERRLVERLIFGTEDEAARAQARVAAGDAAFEDLVGERGLTIADVDLGDVGESELGDAGPPVFAAEVGAVIGPVKSSLGPALFRVNGVLQAQNTPFEDAEPQLRDELAGDRARRVIDAQIDQIDDLLAAGATLEEVARDTDMQLGQIDWHADLDDEIAAYPEFRTLAAEITPENYPKVEQLEQGGIFAMRLDGIIEPQIQPLDAVRDAVVAAWQDQALIAALRDQVAPGVEALASGAEFAEIGITRTTTVDVTRSGFLQDAPPEFIDTVFGLEEGGVEILDGEGRIFVMRLDAIAPPDPEDEEMTRLRAALAEDAAAGKAQDLFTLLSADIRARTGIELDQQALNAVHVNFQ